ncbi:IS30 family transposase [Sphingobium sp.]|uniref:IS30 family transposase n=1 Tax=Sphingobium sp. TaxID=1912891 RepID=UPI002CA7CA73|nr:IS30 family transposase [Sphingobium sp.]HUD94047.1 IS30 family transposase [Sphingobium sp.]
MRNKKSDGYDAGRAHTCSEARRHDASSCPRISPSDWGQRVHTVTLGNGSEFAEHALIDQALDARTCFPDPFASWQLGSNENVNGLLRQQLPKGCHLGTITDKQLQRIEDRPNSRPRKQLGYRTP